MCFILFLMCSPGLVNVQGGDVDALGWGSPHWDPYAMHRGGCLELYYCNMGGWFWWDSSLISTTN